MLDREGLGRAYRLAKGDDVVVMALKGLKEDGKTAKTPQEIEAALVLIQNEIERRYAERYGFAVLPGDIPPADLERLAAVPGVRTLEVRPFLSHVSATEVSAEGRAHVFFERDWSRGESERAALERLLQTAGIDRKKTGLIQFLSPPYLPGAAVRYTGDLDDALGESESFGGAVREKALSLGTTAGLVGTSQTLTRPVRVPSSPLFGEAVGRELEARLMALQARALQGRPADLEATIEDRRPTYERRALYPILQYAMASRDGVFRTFLVRGPPDNFFYVISDGRGDWQLLPITESILAAQDGSEAERRFRQNRLESRRGEEDPRLFGFKQVNDVYSHSSGNELIQPLIVNISESVAAEMGQNPHLLNAGQIRTIFQNSMDRINRITARSSLVGAAEADRANRILDPGFLVRLNVASILKNDVDAGSDAAGVLSATETFLRARNRVIYELPENGPRLQPEIRLFSANNGEAQWKLIASENDLVLAYRSQRAGEELLQLNDRRRRLRSADAARLALSTDSVGLRRSSLERRLAELRQNVTPASQVSFDTEIVEPLLAEIDRISAALAAFDRAASFPDAGLAGSVAASMPEARRADYLKSLGEAQERLRADLPAARAALGLSLTGSLTALRSVSARVEGVTFGGATAFASVLAPTLGPSIRDAVSGEISGLIGEIEGRISELSAARLATPKRDLEYDQFLKLIQADRLTEALDFAIDGFRAEQTNPANFTVVFTVKKGQGTVSDERTSGLITAFQNYIERRYPQYRAVIRVATSPKNEGERAGAVEFQLSSAAGGARLAVAERGVFADTPPTERISGSALTAPRAVPALRRLIQYSGYADKNKNRLIPGSVAMEVDDVTLAVASVEKTGAEYTLVSVGPGRRSERTPISPAVVAEALSERVGSAEIPSVSAASPVVSIEDVRVDDFQGRVFRSLKLAAGLKELAVYRKDIPVDLRVLTKKPLPAEQKLAYERWATTLANLLGGKITIQFGTNESDFVEASKDPLQRSVVFSALNDGALKAARSRGLSAVIGDDLADMSVSIFLNAITSIVIQRTDLEPGDAVPAQVVRLWENTRGDEMQPMDRVTFDRLRSVPADATVPAYQKYAFRSIRVLFDKAVRAAQTALQALGSAA